MTTSNAHGQPAEAATSSDGGVGAALAGGIVGGLVGGAALQSLTALHLTFVGSIVGMGGMPTAFGVWMGFAVASGLLFGAISHPATDYYTAGMTWLTARLGPLRKLTGPLASTSGVGLVYGLVLGVVVGFVGIPAAVGADVPLVAGVLSGVVVYSQQPV